LTYINIPNSVISIGKTCFSGCTSLQNVEMRLLTKVGADAFRGCSFYES
jgi:hypothetical protein